MGVLGCSRHVGGPGGSLSGHVKFLTLWPSEDFWPILADFVDTQVMDVEPTEEEDPQPVFSLTANGHLLVDHWENPPDADESGAM